MRCRPATSGSSIQLLNDASEVRIVQRDPHQTSLEGEHPDTLTLRLPVPKPDVAVPVIELFLK